MDHYYKLGFFSGVLLILSLVGGCSSGHLIKTEPQNPEPENRVVFQKQKIMAETGEYLLTQITPDRTFVQTGVASWYGGQFQGRRTANGEVYDMYRLTAAHKTLPFNSIVEVENLENSKKTMVRINDRGPFIKDRVIDLSLKAARFLGIAEKGTARVRIRLLKPPDTSRICQEQSIESGYYIQAGAFQSRENARNLLQQLNEAVTEIRFEIYLKNGYHKVISEKVASREDAEYIKRLLEGYGFAVFIRGL